MNRTTLGVIVGNRDFFPDRLVAEGRTELLRVLDSAGIDAVVLDENATKLGAVETWQDSQKCADLFRANRDRIDGILVSLPNFGDEKGVADTIRLAELRVPVLIQASPDAAGRYGMGHRRDSFCGKISVTNNLVQCGVPFSLTERHTVAVDSDAFRADLARFVAICRVVNGLRRVRLGMVGARPNAFRTVRYSEKLLEASGATVSVIDLSDIYARAAKLADDDVRVAGKVGEIRAYADTGTTPPAPLVRMAKLAIVIEDWAADLGLAATALQCWDSMQSNYGVNACTIMSMMSDRLMPSACETDVTGLLAMYALQLASGTPSALVDWNNNYADDPDKCVFFHCGNWARSLLREAKIGQSPIHEPLGLANTFGAVQGRTPAGPLTFARVTTDDVHGRIRAYVGEGRFTDDPLDTFGTTAVVRVPDLQGLLRYICEQGFEHHAAMNASSVADILAESFGRYLGWDVYRHPA
jgi:L-fucose isomerase-like protein